MAFVYSITHLATGREYIGVTSRTLERRWREHVSKSGQPKKTHVGRALRKYGPDAFAMREEAVLPTFDEAKIAERILVALRKPEFNMTEGGDGMRGYKRVHSAETRAKIAATLEGRPLTEAHKLKLRGRRGTRGKRMPDEVRAKISASKLGSKPSAETVARRAASLKARFSTVEGRLEQAAKAKRGWVTRRANACR